MTATITSPADLYDKAYYDQRLGPVPYDREQPVWSNHFKRMAKAITERFRPGRLLDVGCAKGFLVEHLRDLGVDAYGVDISPYAISEVRLDIRPYCWVGSAMQPLAERYDLITCIEVAEHLTPEEGRHLIANICQHAPEVIFSSTPHDFSEPTHINVQPPAYWQALFAEHGFYPDLHFDPRFIAPHAMHFRRATKPVLDLAVFSREPSHYAIAQLRLAGPIGALERQARMRLYYCALGASQIDGTNLLGADLFVIQREGADRRLSRPIVAAARRLGRPLVFEIDDLLINIPQFNPSRDYFQTITPDILEMLREVDFITVTTEALKSELERAEPASRGKIYVLPNCVDERIWGGQPPPPRRDRPEPLVIGWFGTTTHRDDLAVVRPAIEYILRKYRGRVVFNFWGYLPPELADLEGVFLMRGPEPNLQRHARDVRTSDIDLAIAPLTDHPFNHAKSNLKWLEYSLCGIPGIYSNITPYSSSIVHGFTGWLVDNSTESWVAALELLINDDALREKLALHAFQEVWRHHRLEVGADRWYTLYHTFVVSGPRPQPQMTAAAASPYRYECSIIVPVFNKVELTRQCLSRIAEVTQHSTYEVIVIDNGSSDETAAFLATLGGDVQIITNTTNLGFAKACNQGARAAKGRYLVFLNNDTIPQEGWLEALVREVTAHADVAVVGSKLLYPNGTIQHAGVVFSRARFLPYHVYRGWPGEAPVVNRRREFQAVTGACMLVRHDIFDAVGGFDEGYRNGFEDIDLCLKIRDHGGRIVYQPSSVLYHLEEQTPGRKDHDADNARRFVQCWGDRWLADEDTVYVPDGYAVCVKNQGGSSSDVVVPMANVATPSLWERVVAVERWAQAGDMEAVRSSLSQGDGWPDDIGVLRWAAQICERAGVPGYAEAFWRRVLDQEAAPDALLGLARSALEKGALAEAAQHLDRLLSQAPSHGDGWLLQGVLALQQQDYGSATTAFATALRHGGKARKAAMGLGMAAIGQGQAEQAWEYLTTMLEEDIDDAVAIHWLLQAGTALQRWQPLTDYLARYLKLNPGDLAVRFALAGVQIRLGHWEAAREAYEVVRLLDPSFDGLEELALTLERQPTGVHA